jgi:phosphopantothenoylcysteine decarboxylase/phosphopantothenate--cysteine ligase
MHPSDEIRGVKSNRLSTKKIVLGVTGSIAAVECVRLSRELIRHGAKVFPVTTQSATKIIHPDAVYFATGNKPIVELTGQAEHVAYCGRVKEPADLLLISPCTANTLSKIAYGIDDSPVTTFATTAIGSGIPILIVPAMHLSMYHHKVVQDNIHRLQDIGVKFIDPVVEANKAKMANIDEIVARVIRLIGARDLVNKHILVIGGSTAESIDDVRVIANRSSGKTAVWLAKNAFYRGANVELWYGWGKEPVPSYIKMVSFESVDDIMGLLHARDMNKFDVVIVCAAIADYIPKKKPGKTPSGKKRFVIEMHKTPKILSELRNLCLDSTIIGFKVEETSEQIEEKCLGVLNNYNLDLVVGNTLSGFSSDQNEIWVVDKNGHTFHEKGDKDYLADKILNIIVG